MNKTAISGIAPFFIVKDVPAALAFYRDKFGFDITFQGPSEDDIFFGIVQRGAAMIMMKEIGVDAIPNYTRDIKKGFAPWDAYCYVPDPDALAAEFASRNVEFAQPLGDNQDNLRGFEVKDADGYVLYFGRPNLENANNSEVVSEFRFYYFTDSYDTTVFFYKNILCLKELRSWNRGYCNKGSIFQWGNSGGVIEIEEGTEPFMLKGGGLYIEADDPDKWYELAVSNNIKIITPLADTSYGHRSFKMEDPNGLAISVFKYIQK